jgi:hypothetical protein
MTDIERTLRAAMHDAIDGEEAAPEELIVAVKRRHRRRNGRLAGVAMVALAAVVLTATAVTGKLTGSTSLNHAASGRTELPSKLSGLPMPAGMNFELLVTTAYGAGWYSTATHKTTPIQGLPAIVGGYEFTRMNGGWEAGPVTFDSPCSHTNCAGPPATFYFITEGSLTATRIGAGFWGNGVAPGTQTGTVWLVTYPRATEKIYASAFAQLVSEAGRPLGPRYRLPAKYLIDGAVGRYLLLYLDSDNSVKSALWDPSTNRVVDHFDNVVTHSSELIVWTRGCERCQLQITNVSTGKTFTTAIPGGQPGNLNAGLSDDGRLLAVQLPSGEIAVFNTVTRSLTRIPGTALSKANFEYFDWQNGGHRLVIAAGPSSAAGPDQLAYWQPGDAQLHVATVRNLTEIADLQTGTV